MSSAATKKAIAPTKGVRPDFHGVAGRLVVAPDPALVFGERASKGSPYDVLLEELLQATLRAETGGGHPPALEFDDVRAKPSLVARGKKKGMKLVFAEKDGKLFVRVTGQMDAVEKRVAEIRRLILHAGPMPKMILLGKLRGAGDSTVDASGLDALLVKLVRQGELVEQEGGKFKVVPKRAA